MAAGPLAGLIGEFTSAAELTCEPRQARADAAMVRSFCWQAGIRRPEQIGTATITAYLADVQRRRSLKTVHNHRSALSRFCEHLAQHGYLNGNPALLVRLRRLEKVPARFLPPDQFARALVLARQYGFWPEVALAVSTGLRLGELIRLRWADVDEARKLLTVRRAKGRRFRVVPLNTLALAALTEQRTVAGRFAHVFPGRRTWRGGWRYEDRPRGDDWWFDVFKPIRESLPAFSGLQPHETGRCWHMLRHTFGTLLAQAGVSFKLGDWMGHCDTKTTLRYVHTAGAFDPDIEKLMPPGTAPPQPAQR